MPTDRLFKFSIPGLMFLLASVFFYDLLGGDLIKILQWIKNWDLIPLFGLIISTPIIGVVFSTISIWLLRKICGYDIVYYPPSKSKIVRYALRNNPSLEKQIISEDKVKWACESYKKEFYPFYQAKLRELLNKEQIDFLDRRWSSFWTHVNNISAIIFSLLIVGLLRLSDICDGNYVTLDLSIHKIIGVSIVLSYCLTGYSNLKTSKQEATDSEHTMFENAIDREEQKQQAVKKDKKTQPSLPSILEQILKLIK